ncbi:hypothetical protein [Weissella confusa]|uniref:hypothetical protein n=1 Tax=Weissella confusa TaxID=1583 RepID=UPI00223AA0AD|nr:hypothetical protein [Weissella confusa]
MVKFIPFILMTAGFAIFAITLAIAMFQVNVMAGLLMTGVLLMLTSLWVAVALNGDKR